MSSNPTYSATVGSVTSQPHNCSFCHKQYATNAKLLQHQRKEHQSDHNYNQKRGQGGQGGQLVANSAPVAASAVSRDSLALAGLEAGQGSGILVTVSGKYYIQIINQLLWGCKHGCQNGAGMALLSILPTDESSYVFEL